MLSDDSDSTSLEVMRLAPTFDSNIGNFVDATVGTAREPLPDFDNDMAKEQAEERSEIMMQEAILDAPRFNWSPKSCVVVNRRLEAEKWRLPTVHYNAEGRILIPERQAVDYFLRHMRLPHPHDEIASVVPFFHQAAQRRCYTKLQRASRHSRNVLSRVRTHVWQRLKKWWRQTSSIYLGSEPGA